MTKKFFNVIKKSSFQIISVLLVISFISGILIWEYNKNEFSEKIFPVPKVDEKIKILTPSISVGLFINNFPNFSFNENKFAIDAFVWFRFPIGTESLNTISKFDFVNGEINYKSDPIIKLIKNDVLVTYQIKASFKAYLNHKNFPLGDHRLNILLDNRSVTPYELNFKCDPSNFILTKNTFVSTWYPVKKITQAGYLKSTLKENDPNTEISYPCAVFTIDFKNNSLQSLITLYFPLVNSYCNFLFAPASNPA